jgi:hypothetical protein
LLDNVCVNFREARHVFDVPTARVGSISRGRWLRAIPAKLLLLTADEIGGLRKRVQELGSNGPIVAPFDPMLIAIASRGSQA